MFWPKAERDQSSFLFKIWPPRNDIFDAEFYPDMVQNIISCIHISVKPVNWKGCSREQIPKCFILNRHERSVVSATYFLQLIAMNFQNIVDGGKMLQISGQKRNWFSFCQHATSKDSVLIVLNFSFSLGSSFRGILYVLIQIVLTSSRNVSARTCFIQNRAQ